MLEWGRGEDLGINRGIRNVETLAWLDSCVLSNLSKENGVIAEICVQEPIIWIYITSHHATSSDLIFKLEK